MSFAKGNPRAFKKGQSGNPAGRPPVVKAVRDLARAHTEEAIATLVGIMAGSEQDSARVAAAREILDRAWGKAPQVVSGDPDNPIQHEHTHAIDWAGARSRFERSLATRKPPFDELRTRPEVSLDTSGRSAKGA